MLVQFEFSPRNLSVWIWRISGVQHFPWKQSYMQSPRLNCRCLLQNVVSFIGLFCKRDLKFKRAAFSVETVVHAIASFKLQVSFAECCLFYRALLQKRPTILSMLLTEANEYLSNAGSTQVWAIKKGPEKQEIPIIGVFCRMLSLL